VKLVGEEHQQMRELNQCKKRSETNCQAGYVDQRKERISEE
jgi:hypothetical protein